MPFGALAPLPLRLGGNPLEGWQPEEHARLCDDLVVINRVTVLAVIVANITSDGALAFISGRHRGGNVLDDFSGTITTAGPRALSLLIPPSYTNNEWGTVRSWHPIAAEVVTNIGGPAAATVSANELTATLPNDGSTRALIVIYGLAEARAVGDYGGLPDKTASKTEGNTPYAYAWMLELQSAKGSAFSNERSGLRWFEILASARSWAGVMRLAEMHASQQNPATSDVTLGRWATVLALSVGDGSDWKLRAKANGKYLLAATGATEEALGTALSGIFGDAYKGLIDQDPTKDFDAPPVYTYSSDWERGPAMYDMGTNVFGDSGVFMSVRSRLMINLTQSPSKTDDEIVRLANVDMYEMISGALPAASTYEWAIDVDSGFTLGISNIGRGSL